jgi:hypothetical protein
VTTHNVIAHRAQQWLGDNYPGLRPYAELLREPANQQAFQNGAAFPDWGYTCPLADVGYPLLPNMSEAAHWVRSRLRVHVCVRWCVCGGACC